MKKGKRSESFPTEIEMLIDEYTDRSDFLYLGRGINYPVVTLHPWAHGLKSA